LNLVGGLVLLGILLYFLSNFAAADHRVRDLCSKITVGMTIGDLNKYVERVGLAPPASFSGTSFVVEKKTFGRYGCRIEASDGVVRSSKYDVSN
jgi:hypothetical protein